MEKTNMSYSPRNYEEGNTTSPAINFCHPFPSANFEIPDEFSIPYMVIAALNIPLAVMATLSNILVFLAIRRAASIHLPSKILLCSLVLTDLGVGLVIQPQYATFIIMRISRKTSLTWQCWLKIWDAFAGSMLGGASFLSMTAVGLDRYVALFHHFRYREIVTTRRVSVVVCVIWVVSIFSAAALFWNSDLYNACVLVNISVCLLVNSVSLIKIYWRLRFLGYRHEEGHQVDAQSQQQQRRSTLNVAKYRRTASTILWIYLFVMLCYSPFVCVLILLITRTVEHNALIQSIMEFCYTILLLNSCINPFVYCFRLPEIRAKVLKHFRRCYCQTISQEERNEEPVTEERSTKM